MENEDQVKTKLSREQRKYVEYEKHMKNTKLIATAGSGKTRSIIERIKYLVENNKFKKNEIFVLTFSRFSKDDFINRVKTYNYTKYIELENISTIDSIAKSILIRTNPNKSQNVEILSLCFRNLLNELSIKKVKKLYKLNKMKCLFVDEAQDLNKIQYDIICNLQIKNNTIINLIGDPNQNIYKFRLSSDRFLLNHKAKQFYLTTNYRSSKNIIMFSKNLRPQITEENKIIRGVKELGKKVNVIYEKSEFVHNYLINKIKNKKSKIKYNDIAIICPTRGVGAVTELGLSVIANLLSKNNIPFEQYYDESGSKDDKTVVRKYKSKSEDKISLLTYNGTKGLEWKIVFVMDFSEKLMNSYPKNKDDSKSNLYLLYVATTRAIKKMYVMCYSDNNLRINPWFSMVNTNSYTNKGRKEYKIPKHKIDNSKNNDTKTSITEILANLTQEQINSIINVLKIEMSEKQEMKDYSDIDRGVDSVLLGIFVEELFSLQIDLLKRHKVLESTENKKFPIIENIINSKCTTVDDYEFSIISKFVAKNQNINWNNYDILKNSLSNELVRIIDKYYDRDIEFRMNVVCSKKNMDIITKYVDDIKEAYKSYLNCKKWKKGVKQLFYICVIQYALNNNHIFHIGEYGKSKHKLLENFKETFIGMNKYAKKIYKKNIISKVDVDYPSIGINGEIDLIINNKITEIKCVKDINIKHYLQLLLYNFCYRTKVMDKYINKYKIINFLTGKVHNVKLTISKSNMFKLLNIICEVSGLRFENLNVVYDLETTGLIVKEKYPEIIQITMREYESGLLIYNKPVKIKNRLSSFISKLTGLTDEKLKKCPDINNTREKIGIQLKNIRNLRLISHNGNNFDNPIMTYYKMIPTNIKVMYYDTINLVPIHLKKKIESKKLKNIYQEVMGKPMENAHSSLGDVDGLIAIMKKLGIEL